RCVERRLGVEEAAAAAARAPPRGPGPDPHRPARAGPSAAPPRRSAPRARGHLARPDVDLALHVEDILGVLACEDLRQTILVGHNYSGMVVTGVADRAGERVAGVVYLDAFVPRDGQSMAELVGPQALAARVEAQRNVGDGWRVPPTVLPPDTSADDVA